MLCGSCGNKVPDIELYCYFCGADLEVFASSTDKELEALKMLEEKAQKEKEQEKKEVEEGIFLEEETAKEEKKEEKPSFLEEEFAGGLKIEDEEKMEEVTDEASERAGPKVDQERQQQYARFLEEEPVPENTQNLEGEKREKQEKKGSTFEIDEF